MASIPTPGSPESFEWLQNMADRYNWPHQQPSPSPRVLAEGLCATFSVINSRTASGALFLFFFFAMIGVAVWRKMVKDSPLLEYTNVVLSVGDTVRGLVFGLFELPCLTKDFASFVKATAFVGYSVMVLRLAWSDIADVYRKHWKKEVDEENASVEMVATSASCSGRDSAQHVSAQDQDIVKEPVMDVSMTPSALRST